MTPIELKSYIGSPMTLVKYIKNKRAREIRKETLPVILMDVRRIYASDLMEVVVRHTSAGESNTYQSLFMDSDGVALSTGTLTKYQLEIPE